MNKIFTPILIILCLGSTQLLTAQKVKPVDMPRRYSAKMVIDSLDDMVAFMENQHPGFYRYTSKPAFDLFIDSIRHTITDSLTELEVFRKYKPVVAKVNCLHTGMYLPPEYTAFLNSQSNLLPLQVYFKGERAFVTKNLSGNPAIIPGDEIKSINGKPIRSILTTLLNMIESDGLNQTLKYLELYYNFPIWYRDGIELTNQYTVTVTHNGNEKTVNLPAVRNADIASDWFLREKKFEKQIEFTIEGNLGTLAIHTFDEPDLTDNGIKFDKYIDRVFDELKSKGITNLIVDLRNNNGGEDAHAAYFTRHFFDAPFRYWDRIEVTPKFSKSIDKRALSYLNAPFWRDTAWILPKAKKTHEFDFYELQQPVSNAFNGKVYLLVNGFCESSCADISAILSYNKKAILVGEETGGGYQGNNSGIVPQGTRVMPFKFSLAVPLQKYFNSVDPKVSVARGVMPDYPVDKTLEEIIMGKDNELALVLELIKGK